MPPTTTQIRHIRRLAVGDPTDESLLPEDTIVALWDDVHGGNGVVELTAAACCDTLAAGYAHRFSFVAEGQSYQVGDVGQQYRRQAADLRRRYYGSRTTVGTWGEPEDEDEFSV